MTRIAAVLVLALASSLVAIPQPAESRKSDARGGVIIEGLTLAGSQYGTPSGLPTTEATDPVVIPVAAGDHFKYSSITCSNPFPPWNNVGLHFAPDYPGITDPASVRHEFEGVVRRKKADGRGTIRGTITTYLCVDGQRQDRIVTSYKAKFRPTSDTSVTLQSNPVPTKGGLAFSGRFKVVSGTGRFEDFRASGSLNGQFTRLGTRPGSPADLTPPGYSEVAFQERGTFRE
jgi:hypothetical protein